MKISGLSLPNLFYPMKIDSWCNYRLLFMLCYNVTLRCFISKCKIVINIVSSEMLKKNCVSVLFSNLVIFQVQPQTNCTQNKALCWKHVVRLYSSPVILLSLFTFFYKLQYTFYQGKVYTFRNSMMCTFYQMLTELRKSKKQPE